MHIPVMLDTVVSHWLGDPNGRYVDCTGGMGGHSAALLEKLGPNASLEILDYSESAVEGLKSRFAGDKRVTVHWARFGAFFETTQMQYDGILADFGISSPELVDQHLGIGFMLEDAPLDMRIDRRLEVTAADILLNTPAEELADLFYKYGGERASRRIAAAIVYDRERDKRYTTTTELRGLCERVLGKFYYKAKIHPATKVFQALRIAVNDELGEVEQLLKFAPAKLVDEGKLVVISFHEGEDRLAKHAFAKLAMTPDYKVMTKKPLLASEDELEANPRARSAKTRVLQKL